MGLAMFSIENNFKKIHKKGYGLIQSPNYNFIHLER